jgi:hypothetical protein
MDTSLLRSARLRIASASEWAYQAGLPNVGQELKWAAKEIETFLQQLPATPIS